MSKAKIRNARIDRGQAQQRKKDKITRSQQGKQRRKNGSESKYF